MHDESPAPFIVIRTPAPKREPYDLALELVGVVHDLVDKAAARFYVKDRLDRAATGLVFELGRAAADVPMRRWRSYRAAQRHAADCATLLDILVHQRAAPLDELDRARARVRELLSEIAPRSRG